VRWNRWETPFRGAHKDQTDRIERGNYIDHIVVIIIKLCLEFNNSRVHIRYLPLQSCNYSRCGRTDRGVSAMRQVGTYTYISLYIRIYVHVLGLVPLHKLSCDFISLVLGYCSESAVSEAEELGGVGSQRWDRDSSSRGSSGCRRNA
jgi:hypothetical protein